MPRPHLTNTVRDLSLSLQALAEAAVKLANSTNDVAREQRVTNLIVRSQISTDTAEKHQLLAEARRRMDLPRRSDPHDEL